MPANQALQVQWRIFNDQILIISFIEVVIPSRALIELSIRHELQIGLQQYILQIVKDGTKLLRGVPLSHDFGKDYFAGKHINIGMKKSPVVVDARPLGKVEAGDEDFGLEFDAFEGAGEWLHVELDDETVPSLLDEVVDVEPAVAVREVVAELAEFGLDPQEKGRFALLALHHLFQSHPIQHGYSNII